MLALCRDIANPSSDDTHFPRYRHFDWYASHSWAKGLFADLDGRDQESVSEAINAWCVRARGFVYAPHVLSAPPLPALRGPVRRYGMALLGQELGMDTLQAVGQLLLAQEVRAANTYWHCTSKNCVYPQVFGANKGVGQVLPVLHVRALV